MAKEVIPIHGEDHCPGGPDPIPCLNRQRPMEYAWIQSTEVQLPAASTVEEVVLDDGDFYDPSPEEAVYDLITNGIQILVPGVYWIRGRVSWNGFRESGNSYVECPQGIESGLGEVHQDTFTTTVTNIHLINEGLPFDVKMNVWHDFGGTPNMTGLVSVLRLGAFSGDSGFFNNI